MTTAIQEQDQAAYTVVSRHRTSTGEVLYVRCTWCRALQMLTRPALGGGALAVGRHRDRCPNCG